MCLQRKVVVYVGLGIGWLLGACSVDTAPAESGERAIDSERDRDAGRGEDRDGQRRGAAPDAGVDDDVALDDGTNDDVTPSSEGDAGRGVDGDAMRPCVSESCAEHDECGAGFEAVGGACADVDECATDNGGCGHPRRATCSNVVGGGPTCACVAEHDGPGCAYRQVYGLDLPQARPGWTAVEQVPYAIDNSAAIAPFDRVAYRLQLDATFMWVEFDAPTDAPAALGVPADETWQQTIDHVRVTTNADNVSEVEDGSGKIEFWSNCYDGGPDGMLDDDDRLLAIDCYGSLQLHGDGATLIAVNGWASSGGDLDVGIGNGSGNPDWTFSGNAASYGVRRLDVYARELATCTSASCGGHGRCDDSSGIVQCACDAGYEGALCQWCTSDHQDNDADGSCAPRCAPGDCAAPGEYCFDDSGTIECLPVDGSDCAAILRADAGAADGRYVIDLDGEGGKDPLLAYCDMSHGAFTLLAVADPRSAAFGNNSAVWSESTAFGSTRIGLAGGDYKARSYGELTTNVIRLCRDDLTRCHDFEHGLGISLQAFFAQNVSYDEYAWNIYGHADTGDASARTRYLTDIGAAEDGTMCGYWLGINEQAMASGIGLMGDANDGCASGANNHWIDDLAIGVGLQSCADTNGCEPLGAKNAAGRQRGWSERSGNAGPWLMLGR